MDRRTDGQTDELTFGLLESLDLSDRKTKNYMIFFNTFDLLMKSLMNLQMNLLNKI